MAIGCTVPSIQVASVSAKSQLMSALVEKAMAPPSKALTDTGAGMPQAPSLTGGRAVASTPSPAITAPQVERAAGGGSSRCDGGGRARSGASGAASIVVAGA